MKRSSRLDLWSFDEGLGGVVGKTTCESDPELYESPACKQIAQGSRD